MISSVKYGKLHNIRYIANGAIERLIFLMVLTHTISYFNGALTR